MSLTKALELKTIFSKQYFHQTQANSLKRVLNLNTINPVSFPKYFQHTTSYYSYKPS